MKIYQTHKAPNPRRVRIFLAEKGIDVAFEEVDLQKGENMSASMRARNPLGKVPILELDDGTCISESMAICGYFEDVHPEPALMGTGAKEKAVIASWERQLEQALLLPVGLCFQHTTGYFKDRMKPIPEFGEEAGKNAVRYLTIIEKQLAKNEYIAGKSFSVADITALCAMDFAKVVKIRLSDSHPNLRRWYDMVSARPSAKV